MRSRQIFKSYILLYSYITMDAIVRRMGYSTLQTTSAPYVVTDGTLTVPVEYCAVNRVPLEWHVLYARDVKAKVCICATHSGSSTMGRVFHPDSVRLKSASSAPIGAQRR